MTTQDTASGPELEELWILKKHYDARLPEDVRLVPLPKTLYRQSIQTWLVDNLITSEEAFSDEYVNKEGVTGSLGASLWRKAFWKRIVNQIETEIAASADEDNEVHEAILFCLSDLMILPAGSGDGTFLRRFHYKVDAKSDTVVTREDEASISGGTTGLRSWPAALHLANHLIQNTDLASDKKVLELGAGAGLIAALVGQLQTISGVSVIATDFHDAVLDRLVENVRHNNVPSKSNTVKTAKLDWSRPQDLQLEFELDLIIASDVVYDPDLAPLLAGCLAYLMRTHASSRALLSQTIRNESTWQIFLSACASNNLRVDEVPTSNCRESQSMVTGRKPEDVIKLFWITPFRI
ncbi:hypothetical protein P389DRAFT_170241 [Cystobasidium minutum MCA 4210]|uniref:uncharacterized protein n=1 Tax=Cystobasidium minutum MCA 4210 TaxID=1397322 RepID=UPI0034CE47EB|eukprot:jgi/Rhomi1/170241/fgenesh1_kg.3_\